MLVKANGQQAACHDCDFKYQADLSAEIISVAAASEIKMNDPITIKLDLGNYRKRL